MANPYFKFKQFRIEQDRCAMKVTTDACVFGAWVAEQLQAEKEPAEHILDIGSGTGLLSLIIAQAIENISLDGIEIDAEAARQAIENVSRSPWKDRIRIQQANFLELEEGLRYHRIVSNPPFYEQDLTGPHKKKNQARHDESLPFRALIDRLYLHLETNGTFFLLLPEKGIQKRMEQLQELGLWVDCFVTFQHSENHPISRIFIKGRKYKRVRRITDSLILYNEKGNYSERVRILLAPYYLSL